MGLILFPLPFQSPRHFGARISLLKARLLVCPKIEDLALAHVAYAAAPLLGPDPVMLSAHSDRTHGKYQLKNLKSHGSTRSSAMAYKIPHVNPAPSAPRGESVPSHRDTNRFIASYAGTGILSSLAGNGAA